MGGHALRADMRLREDRGPGRNRNSNQIRMSTYAAMTVRLNSTSGAVQPRVGRRRFELYFFLVRVQHHTTGEK